MNKLILTFMLISAILSAQKRTISDLRKREIDSVYKSNNYNSYDVISIETQRESLNQLLGFLMFKDNVNDKKSIIKQIENDFPITKNKLQKMSNAEINLYKVKVIDDFDNKIMLQKAKFLLDVNKQKIIDLENYIVQLLNKNSYDIQKYKSLSAIEKTTLIKEFETKN